MVILGMQLGLLSGVQGCWASSLGCTALNPRYVPLPAVAARAQSSQCWLNAFIAMQARCREPWGQGRSQSTL